MAAVACRRLGSREESSDPHLLEDPTEAEIPPRHPQRSSTLAGFYSKLGSLPAADDHAGIVLRRLLSHGLRGTKLRPCGATLGEALPGARPPTRAGEGDGEEP